MTSVDMWCDAEQTKYDLGCWPRTCKLMGGYLNPGSFAEHNEHLILVSNG